MSEAENPYVVKKREVHAVLVLSNGQRVTARIPCDLHAMQHHGRERVKDVLNADSPMFPVWNEDDGRWTLLNKAFVELVELTQPDLAEEDDTDLTQHREIELVLARGTALRGTLLVSTPPERARTLDFLNRGERFFYLDTEQGTRIVGLAHVVSARDVDAAHDPTAED